MLKYIQHHYMLILYLQMSTLKPVHHLIMLTNEIETMKIKGNNQKATYYLINNINTIKIFLNLIENKKLVFYFLFTIL